MNVLEFPTTRPVPPLGSFDELRELGRRAVETGCLEEAESLFREALQQARRVGDQALIDLAVCNRSAVQITLGQHEEVLADLREILVRNSCAENCFLAAYNLARAYEVKKAYKKGLFYARIARDRATALDRPDWLSCALNQIGNFLMDESYFEEATAEYLRALSFVPERPPSVARALMLSNLGYCRMVLGQLDKGFSDAFRSLRWLRQLGARADEAWPHLDLCYAYVEIGRYRRARQHGLTALELAEQAGDPCRIEMALFLLGETERAAGDPAAAQEWFARLQQSFYPNSPQYASLLLGVSMRKMINLRA